MLCYTNFNSKPLSTIVRKKCFLEQEGGRARIPLELTSTGRRDFKWLWLSRRSGSNTAQAKSLQTEDFPHMRSTCGVCSRADSQASPPEILIQVGGVMLT